jgi:glycosyltransferase involved in cell wall biosynthesis
MNKIKYTIIFPCFNEEARLKKNLSYFEEFVKSHRQEFELVFVNDGSTDKTATILSKLKEKYPGNVRLLSYLVNQGKGYAIKTAVNEISTEYVFFMDTDLSTSFDQIGKVTPYLKNFDVVIGIRKHKSAKIIKHQPFYREFMGRIFTFISNSLFLDGIYDATCGFKVFKLSAAKTIFSRLTVKRWVFDTEVLYIAQKKKLRIQQVPIIWENDPATKVSLIKDAILSLKDLLKIWLNNKKGKYE